MLRGSHTFTRAINLVKSGQSGKSRIAKLICAHQFLQARQIGIPCQPFPGKLDETYSLYSSSKNKMCKLK